jgi:hypothetical protein
VGLFKRRRLAAERRPALDRDERVVAWAGGVADEVVVATNLGLWLPGRDRLGWHRINKATWSGRQLTVVPVEVVETREGYEETADAPPIVTTLLDPDGVPDQVRARVTRSVVFTRHHPLAGGGGVRIAGRRVAGRDGVSWIARYDPGTPAAPDVVSELVHQAVDETVTPPG